MVFYFFKFIFDIIILKRLKNKKKIIFNKKKIQFYTKMLSNELEGLKRVYIGLARKKKIPALFLQ